VIFQRVFSSGTTLNEIPVGAGAGGIDVLATWTGLKAAGDGTAVVISPLVSEPTTEPGEKREYGGGNQTVNGVPRIIGRDSTNFTSKLLSKQQSIIKDMKDLTCEVLGVYLVNEAGKIAGAADDIATPTTVRPFRVYSFFIGDKNLGGFEEPDFNAMEWQFYPNWSDSFYVNTPSDFDALTEL
jgi:hypothetical protein